MTLVAVVLGCVALAPQKATEKWQVRTNLAGQYVEVYDVYKGNQKTGTGLRQVIERADYYQPDRHKKYADILKPEWFTVHIVQGRYIVALANDPKDRKVWIVPIEVKNNRIKADKPVRTPYIDIYGGVTSFLTGGINIPDSMAQADAAQDVFAVRSDEETGIRPGIEALAELHIGYQSGRIMTLDVMDRDFNIKFTVHNARELPSRHGKVWRIKYDTSLIAPSTVFLNDSGEPVSPAFPLVREMNGGVLAVPTTLEFARYIPILPDGTLKVEAFPTKGYVPDYALEKKPWVPYQVPGWIKEYITPDGPRFGWSDLNLTKETGPLWRSIEWFDNSSFNREAPTRSVLGQLSDGTWMMYSLRPQSDGSLPHVPYFDKSFPTREALMAAYVPVYNKAVEPEVARRREQARQEAIKYAAAYQEMTKYLEIDPTMSAGDVPMETLRSLLYQTVTPLSARLYNDFDAARQKLPGDYYLKYLAVAYNLRRVSISEADARSYAARSNHSGIKQTFLSIAENIKSEAQIRAAREAEAKRAKERGWSDPDRFSTRPPVATPGWSNPWSNPYGQPTYAEASRRHEQYMNDMWKYLGGQQAWRPY